MCRHRTPMIIHDACTPCLFKTGNQQGPTLQHTELCSVFYSNRNGKRMYTWIPEALCCRPATNTLQCKINFFLKLSSFTDGQRHMEKMLNLLIIREMQIKTTMSYHLTLVRMAIIKKNTNKQMLMRIWWKGNTHMLLVGI